MGDKEAVGVAPGDKRSRYVRETNQRDNAEVKVGQGSYLTVHAAWPFCDDA